MLCCQSLLHEPLEQPTHSLCGTFAGFEPTVSLLSNTLVELLAQPGLWRDAQETVASGHNGTSGGLCCSGRCHHPACVVCIALDGTVNETLRLCCPVMFWRMRSYTARVHSAVPWVVRACSVVRSLCPSVVGAEYRTSVVWFSGHATLEVVFSATAGSVFTRALLISLTSPCIRLLVIVVSY